MNRAQAAAEFQRRCQGIGNARVLETVMHKAHDRQEHKTQKLLVQHIIKCKRPGVEFWHVPNQGKRGYKTTSHLKAMGMRAGVSDLHFLYRGHFYVLELKAKKGSPTAEQTQFISDINAAGGTGSIANSLDSAIGILERWGLIRSASWAG